MVCERRSIVAAEEMSEGVFWKDKRTTRTPGEFSVTGRPSICKLAPYVSISDTWELLLLTVDLPLFVIFKKFYQQKTLTSKLSGCGMYPRYWRVSVQDVKEDYSVWDLVNSFRAPIFVPDCSDALLRSCSYWLLLTYVCKQSCNGLLECYNLKHHFLYYINNFFFICPSLFLKGTVELGKSALTQHMPLL